jgi:hypothetical protein
MLASSISTQWCQVNFDPSIQRLGIANEVIFTYAVMGVHFQLAFARSILVVKVSNHRLRLNIMSPFCRQIKVEHGINCSDLPICGVVVDMCRSKIRFVIA